MSPAAAQAYPDRSICVVVPFAAGGASDVVARAIAPKLTDKLGQSGGGGESHRRRRQPRRHAGRALAADGYTLLLGSSSEIAQYPTSSPSRLMMRSAISRRLR